MTDAAIELRIVDTLRGIDPAQWNALAGDHPMLAWDFLHALHDTGCACAKTGWLPQYVTAWQAERLVGAVPLYLKSHSRGEYVFDWAWADAYERHGIEYYPKALSAIPFSPVSAPKLLASDPGLVPVLAKAALHAARETSSLHVLFPTVAELDLLEQNRMMVRRGVQFHWMNESYATFDEFLARLSHDKRKKIRQERRRVRDAGIVFRRLTGPDIRPEHWEFFHRCYRNTYRAHHSSPYLNLAFFQTIGEKLGQHLMLALAEREGHPVAAALDIFNGHTLYGRYWGATEFVSGMHFEACYYQGIEFCIERGIAVFEGGAQGEHKLARGFTPVETRSAHWLAHPQFARAIENFLDRESKGIAHYIDELHEHSAFRKDAASPSQDTTND